MVLGVSMLETPYICFPEEGLCEESETLEHQSFITLVKQCHEFQYGSVSIFTGFGEDVEDDDHRDFGK